MLPPQSLNFQSKNLFACLRLLSSLQSQGMKNIVICPGSRSAPLAYAASILSELNGLEITTAIDERSAGYFSLGMSAASGSPVGVLTTSGTAVANLLPAAVEADRSCHRVLFLTADRPDRLKNCGANQTVNQEDFLSSVARWSFNTPKNGVHEINNDIILDIKKNISKIFNNFPGPIHINISVEEPLHVSSINYHLIKSMFLDSLEHSTYNYIENKPKLSKLFPSIDITLPGIIVVGQWRGNQDDFIVFENLLREFQSLSNWSVFADPLSRLDSKFSGLIANWELIISSGFICMPSDLQIIRFGNMSPSRNLENFLSQYKNNQILITEDDNRFLDPLRIAIHWKYGFSSWLNKYKKTLDDKVITPDENNHNLYEILHKIDYDISNWLDSKIPLSGSINEISLARILPRILPEGLSVMLSSSSPVRDWLVFSGLDSFCQRCFAFRGASGIDGTLSLAMGLAKINGPTILISGDLSLLHDINGWLFSRDNNSKLIVLLIDNYGGGIFHQFRSDSHLSYPFDNLFIMKQNVDHLLLAEAYNVCSRQVSCLEDLPEAIDWGFSNNSPTLLRVATDASSDSEFRLNIRNELSNYLNQNYPNYFSES